MHLAVEASPNGMVMTDREGFIVLVNSATEKLFGYSRQELIGQPVEILVPKRFNHQHPEYRENYVGESKTRPMGHRRSVRADGARAADGGGASSRRVRRVPVAARAQPRR